MDAMSLWQLLLQVKGYEEDAILATYVLLQEGKKWNKVWFQLKDDRVLYKFVAHEVSYVLVKFISRLICLFLCVCACVCLCLCVCAHDQGCESF